MVTPMADLDREPVEETVELAVRDATWQTIRPVALSLSGLYALFAVSHLVLLTEDIRAPLAALAGLTSVVFVLVAVLHPRRPTLARQAYAFSFSMVMLALVNSALHLFLSSDILQTTNLILVLFGASLFIPSIRWFAGAAVLTVAAWLASVVGIDEPQFFTHFVFAMVSALVVASLFSWSRSRSVRENHRLRLISESQREEMELLATHDFLTGVANRRLFIERLELAMADSKRTGDRVGLLSLDLDDFKVMNDTYGHAFGDEVLTAVADRLRGAVRETDLAARLGGDEFGVLLTHLNTSVDLDIASERIHAALATITFPGKDVQVLASIGTAIYPDDAETLDAFFDAADAEMYRIKREHHEA